MLPVRGSHLTVAGVTDNVAGRFGLPGPDPHRALEGTPRPRILMAHKPELFHETAPEIDLQLSGHTHGGLALLLDQGVALFNRQADPEALKAKEAAEKAAREQAEREAKEAAEAEAEEADYYYYDDSYEYVEEGDESQEDVEYASDEDEETWADEEY